MTPLFDLRLPISHQLRQKLHESFFNPISTYLLWSLITVHLDSAPSLILPTSSEGAGIENFKVRKRGSYFLRFSGTAWCAVSSLFSFAPFSCLFLQTDILYFSMHMGKCCPRPSPTSPPGEVPSANRLNNPSSPNLQVHAMAQVLLGGGSQTWGCQKPSEVRMNMYLPFHV